MSGDPGGAAGREREPATLADPVADADVDAWEALGRVDPLWAVLTEPARRGRRWTEAEFLATGRVEVASILGTAAHLGRPVAYRAALDFGCGVGRLALPLADRFETVVGVDVSRAMIERARRIAARPNISLQVLTPGGAVPAPDRGFDLVLSLYVLQHLASRSGVVRQLQQLASLVADGGLLVVQVPAPIPLRHRLQPRRHAYALLRRLGLRERALFDRLGLSPMRLIGVRQAEVRDVLAGSGLDVLDVHADVLRRSSIDSFTYYATPVPNRIRP